MTVVDIVRRAGETEFTSEDGDPFRVELLPGLSETELREFASKLPCPLRADVRELLAFCRGLEGSALDVVDFTGRDLSFEYEPAFPHGLPIGGDGFGNFWVVDLQPHSREFGPIYFACHDAPVILFQSPHLEHFLRELV